MDIVRKELASPELVQLRQNIIDSLITELFTELTVRISVKESHYRSGGVRLRVGNIRDGAEKGELEAAGLQ
jgi:hypothetical protein